MWCDKDARGAGTTAAVLKPSYEGHLCPVPRAVGSCAVITVGSASQRVCVPAHPSMNVPRYEFIFLPQRGTPPRNTAAAPAGASSPPIPRQQSSGALRDFEHGLDALQQPYSDAAASKVVKHLEAAGGARLFSEILLRAHEVDLGTGYVVKLLNKYLQWFLSGAPTNSPASSQSSSTPNSQSSASSSPSSGHTSPTCSKALADGIVVCLTHISSIVTAVATTKSLQGAVAGLRPLLVAAGTGTLSLVGRAAGVAMPYFQQGIAPSKLCIAIIAIWSSASGLVHSSLTPMVTTPDISSHLSSFNIWRQAPGMAQALPAVADMVHWWLQLPEHMRGTKGRSASNSAEPAKGDDFLLSMLVQQLQLLAEGAVAVQADKTHTSGSSGSGATAAPTRAAELLSSTAVMQVERFLWHTLATATASLEHHNRSCPSSLTTSSTNSITSLLSWVSNTTPTTTSSSSSRGGRSSSSSSNRVASSKLSFTKVPLPSGAGYKVQFDLGNSSRASRQAAAALLQLATAGLPQQQLLEVAPAEAWLRQFQPPPPGFNAVSLLEILMGKNPISNVVTHPTLEAAGYLCWPYAHAAPSADPPHISSSSRSSSTAATSSSTSSSSCSGGCSAVGTASAPRPPPHPSSTMAGVGGPDPFNNPGAALQLLAAAAAARWRDSRRRIQAAGGLSEALRPHHIDGGLGPSSDADGLHTLLHLLLLLVQQMQGVPVRYRDWFLNSRAGSAVLQMLGELRFGEAGQSDTGDWVVPGGSAPAAAQRQQGPAKSDWKLRSVLWRVAVRKLLLPGLLLHPAQMDRGSANMLTGNGSSSSSSGGGGGSSSDAAGSSTVILDLNKAKPVPLMVVPPSALQLPPGCTPPPAAFFLTEQLLREAPLATSLHMAMRLLQGCVPLMAPGKQQHKQQMQQQKQQQHSSKVQAEEREEALAGLQRLAYCSLASSVVQAMAKKPALGAEYAGQVLQLAAQLVQVAEKEAAATGSSSSSSSMGSQWGLAASLAAALAGGAYKAHSATNHSAAAGRTDRGWTTLSTTIGSSSLGGDSSPCCSAAAGATQDGLRGCRVCLLASGVFIALRCLELAAAVPAGSWASALAVASKWRGTTLYQHLQQQLLALAWRHPVPGVCGNVLCGRLEGPAAVGVVRGRVGSLCGGCKAAWYCCEGCQRAAWAAHSNVCRTRG